MRGLPYDSDLVRCARTGDKQAFAELVRRHRDTAQRLAVRMLADADLAADACQEACVVAMLSLDRLATPERFGAWLCGITLNISRRVLEQRRAFGPLPELDLADPAPGPDELAEAADIARRVRRSIAELAPGQAEAVLLFYLEGLSHREVAAELAISVGAVKARLHQARAALMPKLASEFETEEAMVVTSTTTSEPVWVDATVSDVRVKGADDPGPCPHVVVLQEVNGQRELGIWMLEREAVALARSMVSKQMPRPMTYQFAAGLVSAAGATVRETRISRVADRVFYAETVLEGQDGEQIVDARPSDALNLALVTGARIRVEDSIFSDAENQSQQGAWRVYATSLAEEMRQP